MRIDTYPHGESRLSIDYMWLRILSGMGHKVELLPFGNGRSATETFKKAKVDAIILTGGNDVSASGKSYFQERNTFELELLDFARQKGTPVVGICRGMQIMNLFCGGRVQPIIDHVAKPHHVKWNGRKFIVNSFHDYGMNEDDLGSGLIIDAWSEDKTIEAFHHTELPWQAVMWHPERNIDNPEIHHDWLRSALEGK